jgi:hypothetical protein
MANVRENEVIRSKVEPICPFCRAEFAGISMRVDPVPGVATAGVTTFSCAKCGCILGMCWMPRETANELALEKPRTN